ncbi:hypothetical protein NP118_23640, partial [Salmonella enterica]|nr:hypothetical protein [Salmonella enterica]
GRKFCGAISADALTFMLAEMPTVDSLTYASAEGQRDVSADACHMASAEPLFTSILCYFFCFESLKEIHSRYYTNT